MRQQFHKKANFKVLSPCLQQNSPKKPSQIVRNIVIFFGKMGAALYRVH
jgi:hypothetical protein